MKKEYTINELASILGCSRTAIVKKIKTTGDNSGVERYKNRYDVVISNGIKVILLDEQELEDEKACSRGFKTVSNNGVNSAIDDDIIDVEPIKETFSAEMVFNFTERYIERFETFQENTYNELKNVTKERDEYARQIYLLEDTERRAKDDIMKTKAENVVLKKRNTMLTVALSVITLVLVCFITFYITSTTLYKTVTEPVNTDIQKKVQAQPVQQQEVIKSAKSARNVR